MRTFKHKTKPRDRKAKTVKIQYNQTAKHPWPDIRNLKNDNCTMNN